LSRTANLEAAFSFVIVVADTFVIVNLVRVGHDRLLQKIYGEVWIPTKVAEEFRWQASVNPRFHGLSLPDWLQTRDPAAIPQNLRDNDRLDPGECAALALAVEIQADAILIDEENGREIASEMGLKRVGILGILLRAKNDGLVSSLTPVFDSLQRDANFWISPALREHVLRQAGEI
jgi:predicted nucleic acid-binding protein